MKLKSLSAGFLLLACSFTAFADDATMSYPKPNQVKIIDKMWTPIMERTYSVTIPDVLDKFEGKHVDHIDADKDNFWSPDKSRTSANAQHFNEHNTMRNFSLVADGHVADGGHFGFPWYDGLIYETITGVADFLSMYPDKALEQKIDGYISLIELAQKADKNGYINTYTTLMENDHRWGENGGNLRWQHDVYNSGALVEAGVHYYKATGKTKLLEIATRLANYMYDYMAGANHNVIPGHALPEDALMQLYHLYTEKPSLAKKVSVPVDAGNYKRLAEFWIEQRGHTEGRRPLQAYAQDSIPVFESCTIEGHAVRATLFATGVADVALANGDKRYIDAAHRLWNNMVSRRMFITGGVGAIHHDEKFGPDYYLPNNAYLETCAAIGAGLFSWRMNELTRDARYMDVLERIVFNSIPTAVSQKGDNYTYQNPLNADNMNRWPWHDCPCCPPMLLKALGQLPSMIYGYCGNNLYVNLFIGSEATLEMPGIGKVTVSQQVDWNSGKVDIKVKTKRKGKPIRVMVRVPGWTRGEELPMNLYKSRMTGITYRTDEHGYRSFTVEGETKLSMNFDVSPRVVHAAPNVATLSGQASLASGPFVHCIEKIDNEEQWHNLSYANRTFSLDTVNTIAAGVPCIRSNDGKLTAIPFFMIANRCKDTSYRVWVRQ